MPPIVSSVLWILSIIRNETHIPKEVFKIPQHEKLKVDIDLEQKPFFRRSEGKRPLHDTFLSLRG